MVTARGRRETNQDRVCALRTLVGREPAVLLAVADGIGGLPAGEQSADLALQVVTHYAHYVIPEAEPTASGARSALDALLRAAGRRVWLWARENGLGGSAGCTLVCALVWGRRYLVANAGDSRCYYVNSRGASVLTCDHAEEGRLSNALGWPGDLRVDLSPMEDGPGVLDEDCALLVCSDGLHAVVAEADLHAAFHETQAVDEACRRLVALALARGSRDNVSVAAVEIGRLRRPL